MKNRLLVILFSSIMIILNICDSIRAGADKEYSLMKKVVISKRAVKISQLVGEYDRELKVPTQNLTFSRYKLSGTDLGVPFRYKDRTYLLFGDSFGYRGGDAIAYTTDRSPEDGIRLIFIHDKKGRYKPIKIPGIDQAGFEVPMEGTSLGD